MKAFLNAFVITLVTLCLFKISFIFIKSESDEVMRLRLVGSLIVAFGLAMWAFPDEKSLTEFTVTEILIGIAGSVTGIFCGMLTIYLIAHYM